MISDDPTRIVFLTVQTAEEKIAGVARAAHATAQAVREGAGEIHIVLADGGRLSATSMHDVIRAGQGAKVHFEKDGSVGPIKTLEFDLYTTAGLLKSAEKASDGFVSRWLNRPISRQISAILLRIPAIRPWHVTLGVGIVAVAMFLCLLIGTYGGLIAGALLFQAASVLDGVDGEIARVTYRSSVGGALLDTYVDMGTNLAFFLGVTINLTVLYGKGQAIAGGCAVLVLVTGLTIMRTIARRLGAPGNFNFLKSFYRERFPTGIAAAITDALVITTSRDFFALMVAIVVVLGGGYVVTYSLCTFAAIWLAFILLAVHPLLQSSGEVLPEPLTLAVDDEARVA